MAWNVPCHAGGRGFEPRRSRQYFSNLSHSPVACFRMDAVPAVRGGHGQHVRIRCLRAGLRRHRRRDLVADVCRELVACAAKSGAGGPATRYRGHPQCGRATSRRVCRQGRCGIARDGRRALRLRRRSHAVLRELLRARIQFLVPGRNECGLGCSRFRPGDTVIVWYDPDLPATAVLNRAATSRRTYYRNLALLVAGIAVVAASTATAVIASMM